MLLKDVLNEITTFAMSGHAPIGVTWLSRACLRRRRVLLQKRTVLGMQTGALVVSFGVPRRSQNRVPLRLFAPPRSFSAHLLGPSPPMGRTRYRFHCLKPVFDHVYSGRTRYLLRRIKICDPDKAVVRRWSPSVPLSCRSVCLLSCACMSEP